MFIPLGTDRPLHRPTTVTYALVATNIFIYIVTLLVDRDLSDDLRPLVLVPAFGDAFLASAWWTFITYAFLHGGFWHLAGNMLILWVLGPNVEDRFGRIGFTGFYLLGGVASALVHMAFSEAPVVGASGAIAAVTGSYLVLFPVTRIRILWLFIVIGVFVVPSWWFIAFAIARDFLPVLGGSQGRIAHEAHLGGYAFGIAASFVLLLTKAIPREPYELATIIRQARRRRAFRELSFTTKATGAPMARTEKRGKGVGLPEVDAPRVSTEASELRLRISTQVAEGDLEAAARGYAHLIDRFGAEKPATVLSRRAQLDLANYLYQSDDHATAAAAYRRFLETYPHDAESARTRLLLAVLCGRYLGEVGEARRLLREARPRLREHETELADQLERELGAAGRADGEGAA